MHLKHNCATIALHKNHRKHDRCPTDIQACLREMLVHFHSRYVESLGWVKREAGVSPARTRRCKRGAFLPQL